MCVIYLSLPQCAKTLIPHGWFGQSGYLFTNVIECCIRNREMQNITSQWPSIRMQQHVCIPGVSVFVITRNQICLDDTKTVWLSEKKKRKTEEGQLLKCLGWSRPAFYTFYKLWIQDSEARIPT